MATAKWATPASQGSNIASTTLDSLSNAGTSAFVTHDNSTDKALYAAVVVNLGSLNPTTGATISLRVFTTSGSGPDVPDNTGSVGGGDVYTQPVTTGSGAKVVVFPMVRLYPFSLRLCLTNNTNVTLAASSNSLKVQPYNEDVS